MTPKRVYDPLRAGRLDAQLVAALKCLSQLGPYSATTTLPTWLREAVVSLLKSVEEFLPEENFFDGIKSSQGQPRPPSQLAAQAGHCWELSFPLLLGCNALELFAETDKSAFGFSPKQD